MARSEAIEAFLASGTVPVDWSPWNGDREAAERSLRRVLCRIVAHRCENAPLRGRIPTVDVAQIVVQRVQPMLEGLLQPAEACALARHLRERVCVVTPESFPSDIERLRLDDAWTLANVLLEDLGAPPISDSVPQLDGLCAGGYAWVPPGGLRPPTTTTDVVVHEVAHLLHTLSPADLGLGSDTEPLITLDGTQYESFAYACELWSCGSEQGVSVQTVSQAMHQAHLLDVRVDEEVLRAALRAAAAGGWRSLLHAIQAPAVVCVASA